MLEKVHSCCIVHHLVLLSHHVRNYHYFPTSHLEDPEEIPKDYLHDAGGCHLHYLYPLLLQLIHNVTITLRFIIYPKDQLICIGLRHRDLFQLSSLNGSLKVVVINEEVGERQN